MYDLEDGGFLVKTRDSRWIALDKTGGKIYGPDAKPASKRKKGKAGDNREESGAGAATLEGVGWEA